jgi:NAD(P)H-hydrate epimerase
MNQGTAKSLRIPALTTEQMREVDRLMITEYGIDLPVMMENAGRNLAELCRRLLGSSVIGKKVIVAAGKGNNGGGGLVSARHLSNWGAEVTVILPDEELKHIPEKQLGIIEKLPVELIRGNAAVDYLAHGRPDIAVDALIGYGIRGDPRGWMADIIKGLNKLGCPVLSLDLPSGLDSTTGKILNPCVKAAATMTLALPKTGLLTESGKEVAGTIYLADISVPKALYNKIGLTVDTLFKHDTIVNIEDIDGGI